MMTTSTEKKSRFDGSPTYCLSSSSDVSTSSSSISTINQRMDQIVPYRAFHKIPEQILRYILTFLNARELSRRCVYVCKRFTVESKRAAKTILDVLADRYRWIKLLLVDRNQQTADENRYTSEKRTILDGNKEKNVIPKKQNITSSGAMTSRNMKGSGDYERMQLQNILKNNLKNNIYVLHTLTSPSIISVGGNFEPKRVDSYDVIHNKWIELSQTNIGREVFFEVLWYCGFVYAFCGIHHSSYGSVERLNPLTNIWTKVTSLPGKLAAAVGTVLNEKLYIIGGYDWHLAEYSDAVFLLQKKEKNVSSKNLNSIIPINVTNINNNNVNNSVNMKNNNNNNNNNNNTSNNTNTNASSNNSNNKSNKSVLKTEFKWILQESRLLQGRSSHACVSFEGKIWIAGGILEGQDFEGTPTVEIFDPSDGIWVHGPPLNVNRFRLRLFVINNVLHAVGGDRDPRGRLIVQTIEKLSSDRRSWIHVTAFPVERRGFLSSLVGSVIFLVGGRTQDVPLHTWDAFDCVTGVWYSHVKEEGKKEKDKETEIENNSVNQDIFVIPSVTRKINSLNENRITESFEYSGNYGHNYINGNGCYESMCSTENENDYGDDMMIDENTHTTHEDEKDRKMNIEIERSKINSNKSNTNKNVKNEKSIQPTEEELIKKSKMNKLSDKLMNYSMSLNRSCGVVGGRSVTIPEGKISW